MKEIRLAGSAGFCFGVSRSVDMAEKLIEEKGACASYGQLIHNEDVVARLAARGLRVVDQPMELRPGETVLIRAHGVAKEVYAQLEGAGGEVVDATCPKVKAIHTIVSRAADEGRFVIIIGMPKHPEVEGICGWCGAHKVFENSQELALWLDNNSDYWEKPITVVVQTTQTRSNFTECCNVIKKRCTNAKISDTICLATFTRQEEAAKLASECDAMVVIGGRHSANSVHLAQICREHCANVQFIEGASELDADRLKAADIVGLTAGASTPAWIIKEVRNKMSDEIKIEETAVEKEMSFDEMLEETLKTIYNGDKVTGTVVAITGTEISVDLGAKYSGFIPTSEFTDDGVKVEDAVKVGDEIEAVVVRVNDIEGTAMLSKKRLDAAKMWTEIEEAVDNGAVLEGVVTEENKGGVVVNVKGVRVFVPASQTDLPREAEMSQLLKKTVRLKITEVNKARKRVVGSIRRVAQAERRERTEAIWNEIEIGKKYHGVVKSLTSYGAFVDIGGIDGMVHVSELSWGRIHQPSEVLSVGDEVDVYVINFDKEKRKISLGYKDPDANPWTVFTNKYQVGSVASVTIVKLMPFGAFAEVLPGVDGLIHISQIANRRIGKPEDVLTVGDVVDAKITAIDEEKHKISLSIRALSEPAPAVVEEPVEEDDDDDDGRDALVYEVSATGEATGVIPEE
ncbi:MAG: bifunctional 4-hydroxy-3-methylbut-2-enyl diphosphate reductase/30S ribosomal protein S1 [bacterium]|nr:bifunctional 4-hydroxy-3-methylbut-2-enyl diphosphate reductase/30S ribosomal protein S1 [bacterium]MDY4635302.1 bifunctional 4-hydroxy-3-methylbut-2-enyl diphosphate reductase/30S ribosomal protein S1 [Candidatus Limivicinus sp.]